MNVSRITVLIADRDPAQRGVIARVLHAAGDIEVVGEAGSTHGALSTIRELRPDVALVECDLPGLDVGELLRSVALPTRVVLVTANGSVEPLIRGLELGAAGGVSKTSSAAELRALVAAAARGETRLPGAVQQALVDRVRTHSSANDAPKLTARQQQVLELVAEGLSGPQIAKELVLSPATVKTHLEKLYENLGVTDRAAAVAVAMRTGVLS
jgi:two-component system nitrate/nitrite response regulator NarL